jgi:hypothetical protein
MCAHTQDLEEAVALLERGSTQEARSEALRELSAKLHAAVLALGADES